MSRNSASLSTSKDPTTSSSILLSRFLSICKYLLICSAACSKLSADIVSWTPSTQLDKAIMSFTRLMQPSTCPWQNNLDKYIIITNESNYKVCTGSSHLYFKLFRTRSVLSQNFKFGVRFGNSQYQNMTKSMTLNIIILHTVNFKLW